MNEKIIFGILKAIGLATWIGFNMFLSFIIYYMFATNAFMNTLYIIWMLVLPLLAICMMIVIPILWFAIMPGIAKRLIFARFRPGALQGIADDTGMFDIQQSKFELPEGIAHNKLGWYLYPRPTYKPTTEVSEQTEEGIQAAEHLMLKKCILRDIGKPIWFGYRGKMGLVNPLTLAALENKPKTLHNPSQQFANLEMFAATLSKDIQKPLSRLIGDLKERIHEETITWFDPRLIREVLPQNYTESQIDAVAINRENYGRKSQGKDVFKIALLILVFSVAVISIIGILWFVTQGGF